jgi:hypothetical protein
MLLISVYPKGEPCFPKLYCMLPLLGSGSTSDIVIRVEYASRIENNMMNMIIRKNKKGSFRGLPFIRHPY